MIHRPSKWFQRDRGAQAAIAGVAILLVGIHVVPAVESPGTRFSIQQQGQEFWLAGPGGKCFFSLGVCCVNQGAARSDWDAANPSYAAWRHYPNSNDWALATLDRLETWGFTTVGGWSDFATLRSLTNRNVAFAPVIHIGSTAGAPWWDMWDPKVVAAMDQVARDAILPLRDDPRVIGYYTDNEIGWWNAILFQVTLQQAPTSGQRQRLIALLKETYGGDWSALMKDFETSPVLESWEQLEQHGTLFLQAGGQGIKVERQFVALLAKRYYSLIHEIVRKHDPKALILGDRYPSFYYPEVVRACEPYVDVVSCNVNAAWSDGTIPRFLLGTLHKLNPKPVMVGEFYGAARENSTGNKNNHGVYPLGTTQRERAVTFRNTLQRFLETPFVIGADWFQYYDEARHGRFDGENFNFGLVDIQNQPYGPLTSAAAALDVNGIKSKPEVERFNASGGVPSAPKDPFANFEPTLGLKHWDRERGYVQPASEFPLADLYVCWDKNAIYLGLCAQDVVEDVYYRGKMVPAADRAEWVISIGGSTNSIRGRVGAGREPVFNDPSVRVVSSSGINGNVRTLVAVRLPAKLFGTNRFKAGDYIEFSSTFFSHCHAYSTEWSGRLRLGGR